MPRNLVDYKSSNSYASKNYINSYFCIDLIDQRIQIHDYVIKNPEYTENFHLEDWVLEVSNDKTNWITIDSRCLKGTDTYLCKVKWPSKNFYRYIRIRQTGKAYTDDKFPYIFGVRSIDFYGKFLRP